MLNNYVAKDYIPTEEKILQTEESDFLSQLGAAIKLELEEISKKRK